MDPWPYQDGLREVVRLAESTEADSLIVGVTGGSCAGKSTISQDLSEMIQDSAVLAMDHYYHSRPIEGDRVLVNFDEPDAIDFQLLKYHLKQLRVVVGINRPVYDFVSHTRTGLVWFAPCRVVILDGLFALHTRLKQDVDLGVYVECDEPERQRRRILRDSSERGRSRSSILSQFETTVHPMHKRHVEETRLHADVVLFNQKR